MEAKVFYIGCYVLVSLLHLASSRVDTYSGWNTSPDTQYHIQTDEGDERYFKYQTRSGQYRKEKRLQDGTVVGTYGWVDPNGFLRLRDYIADNDGYRILKSKMIYVGSNSIAGESVAPVKSYPQKYAALSTNPYQLPFEAKPHRFSNTYLPPSQNTYLPPSFQSYVSNYPSTTPASTLRLSTLSTTPADVAPTVYYYPSSTPVVDIRPNSVPKFSSAYYVTSTPSPSVAVFHEDSTPRPVAVYSSTPKPVAVNYVSTPSPSPSYSSTPRPAIGYSSTRSSIEHSTPRPTISAIGYTASTPSPEPILPPISGKFASNNNFITETEKNKLFFQHDKSNYYKKRYVDYQANDQGYDGISTVQNGFKYFLPRQYHEEQSSPDGRDRTGSFGYIDPFGIRRVIYYNTSPERGFVHRKNNRYVGFNATPYDPRP